MSTNTAVSNTKSLVCGAAAAAYAVLLGVAACTAAFLVPIQAEAHDVTIEVPVSATGLDLSQQTGALELYRRLQRAARVVCGHGHRVDLAPLRGYELVVCYEKAVGKAVRSVNQPQVTMIYLKTHTLQDARARGIDAQTLLVTK